MKGYRPEAKHLPDMHMLKAAIRVPAEGASEIEVAALDQKRRRNHPRLSQ